MFSLIVFKLLRLLSLNLPSGCAVLFDVKQLECVIFRI